jgi:hypothetical protein
MPIFVQEQGVISALPGARTMHQPGSQGADNDYYFSGVYSTVSSNRRKSSTARIRPSAWLEQTKNSRNALLLRRDLDLRYHFNLTAAQTPAISSLSASMR